MSIDVNYAGPNYFRTVEIPIIRGRDRRDQNLAGKRVGPDSLAVVGAAKSGKYYRPGEEARSFMYLPLLQSYRPDVVLTVRANVDAAALPPAARRRPIL